MKPVIIIAIAFVLLIPTTAFAEYKIDDICEWATFQVKYLTDKLAMNEVVR